MALLAVRDAKYCFTMFDVDRHGTNNDSGAGPQREIFAGGTKIDAGPPKFSEALTDKSKKVFTQIWSRYLPNIRDG